MTVVFRQPKVRTIEGVLFNAMVKAGAVSEDNADDPVKVECFQLSFISSIYTFYRLD